jgi:hypothetical protein
MKTPASKEKPGIKKQSSKWFASSKENIEDITYKSNCVFLTKPAVSIDEDDDESNLEEDICEIPIVLDLETYDFEAYCDILQIAAKCGKTTFATHVIPSRQVLARAAAASGLTNCNGDLVYRGVKV